jgi:flagellar motility protein MotE (MotC chaperone)
MKLFNKIRVLPVTIFAATLMVTVKVSDIWDGFDSEESPIQIGRAQAQAQAQEKQDLQEPPAKNASPEGELPEGKEQAPAEPEGGAQAEGEEKVNEDNPDNDPTLFTQPEIDLLQQLANRREGLEKQADDLLVREGLVTAAEQRINTKIRELKRLQATIQSLIKTHDEQQENKLRSLVRIYEAMKPKDAARIFEQLELDTLLSVAERMKERRLAPVMAQMNPEKAKEMTVQLSKLRNLPGPAGNSGG